MKGTLVLKRVYDPEGAAALGALYREIIAEANGRESVLRGVPASVETTARPLVKTRK